MEKVSTGVLAICSPIYDDSDPQNNSKDADRWGPPRSIRAELVGWLCGDEHARKRVPWQGIMVYGPDVTGALDLSFVNLPFPLMFRHCRLKEAITLYGTGLPQLDLGGSSLEHGILGAGAIVKDHVFF